jgi:hypothetical protein
MPKIDGRTFYRTLSEAVPAMSRRVVHDRGRRRTDAEQFLNESGCRWLAKPFRLGDLLRAVRDTLA